MRTMSGSTVLMRGTVRAGCHSERPAAVFLVVVHHATQWPIPGGASVLLMIVGFNLARFQSNALFAGKPGGP